MLSGLENYLLTGKTETIKEPIINNILIHKDSLVKSKKTQKVMEHEEGKKVNSEFNIDDNKSENLNNTEVNNENEDKKNIDYDHHTEDEWNTVENNQYQQNQQQDHIESERPHIVHNNYINSLPNNNEHDIVFKQPTLYNDETDKQKAKEI